MPFQLNTVNITGDPELFEKYKERIPVVMINEEEVFVYRISARQLRKKILALVPNDSIWTRLRRPKKT